MAVHHKLVSESKGKQTIANLSDLKKKQKPPLEGWVQVLVITLWLVVPSPTEHFSPTRVMSLLVRVLDPMCEGARASANHT